MALFVSFKKFRVLLPVFSIIVFSPSQWENWLWGWQIQIFLNLAAVVWGIVLISSKNLNWKKIILSLFLGIIASYSFSTGLLYWIVSLTVLLLVRSNKNSFMALFIHFISAFIVIFFYFNDFKYSTPAPFALSQILNYLIYFFSFLGAPVIGIHPLPSSLMGLAGFIIFAYFLRKLFHPMLFGLGMYAILGAILVSFGRWHLGSMQAISSRYITITNLLWIANLTFLYLSIFSRKMKSVPRIIPPLFYLIIILLISFSVYKIRNFYRQNIFLSNAKKELITGRGNLNMKNLYFDEKVISDRNELLKKYNLWIYKGK